MKKFEFFLAASFLFSLFLFAACGDGSSSSGGCDCETGLTCVDGACVCQSDGCCIDDTDCPPGQLCDTTIHQCSGNGDGDIDTDYDFPTPTDGDLDCEDDCENTENDTVERTDDDVEISDDDLTEDNDTPTETDTNDTSDIPTDGDQDEEFDETDPPQEDCKTGSILYQLAHTECLPYQREQVLIEHVSSRDMDGGNDDASATHLYLLGNEKVLMHSKRPGCISRMWFGKTNDLNGYRFRFYIDGEDSARINLTGQEMMSGNHRPFVSPLAGLSDQAFYSYVPICYTSEILVTLEGGISQGYNITYQTYPNAQNVEPFSMEMNIDPVLEFYENHAMGENPNPDRNTFEFYEERFNIGAGEYQQLMHETRARVIDGIYVDIAPINEDIMRNAYLEIYWEGKSTPDVRAPLGLFFGHGFEGDETYTALMNGYDSANGRWYNYYPMPFNSEAEVIIRNESSSTIEYIKYTILLGDNTYPQGTGLFHARYQEAIPTETAQEFTALETTGKGHVVGINLAMESDESYNRDFLDGDERIYIDGLSSPNIYGTGTDTFFNGYNRFRTAIPETPLFWAWKNSGSPTWQYIGRRTMIGDAIAFNRHVKMDFEHWADYDNTNALYRSVTFYYRSCLEAMSLSDAIDIGTLTDENDHAFYITGESSFQNHQYQTGYFEGDVFDSIEHMDTGRGILRMGQESGYMEMELGVDADNVGVRLVRLLDQKIGRQDAIVYVDNELVGHWYTPASNQKKRWKESIFDIPPEFTSDKSLLRLKFEFEGGTEWNAYNVMTYSILPTSETTSGPGAVEAISTEMSGLDATICWATPPGVPPEIYHVYRYTSPAVDCSNDYFVDSVLANPTGQTCITIPDLTAQTTYYVRIQAEDCTGTRGPCSQKFDFETGLPPEEFEAENILNETSTNPPGVTREVINTDFSNNTVLCFDAEATGQLLVLTAPIRFAGEYDIEVVMMDGPSMGQFRFLVDNFQQESHDSYAPEITKVVETLGTRYLHVPDGMESQDHNFLFRVTGKNAASTGYSICIDKIVLK